MLSVVVSLEEMAININFRGRSTTGSHGNGHWHCSAALGTGSSNATKQTSAHPSRQESDPAPPGPWRRA